jgi:hypothetical protein
MKKYINIILIFIMLSITNISFAENIDGWFLAGSWDILKTWDIWFSDIPVMITYAINFFMWIAATISVIFIIIWAYKILFGSISQDKTKWRDTIFMAITGFIIASLAWLIIKLILDNFS